MSNDGEYDEYINDEEIYLNAAKAGDLKTVKELHDTVIPFMTESYINGEGEWAWDGPKYGSREEIKNEALLFGATNNHLEIVQFLIQAGGEPEIALKSEDKEIKEWVEQYIENHPIVRDYISDLSYELSNVLTDKGIRQVEYDLDDIVLSQFGERVQGEEYTPESYDLLNKHITDDIKDAIDGHFDYIKNQAIGDGCWDEHLLEQDEIDDEEEINTTGDVKYDESNKSDLLKEVVAKQSSKAQKLSDEIESDGFTYHPPVNKTTGKKL
ncbi:hypothetical protein [Burkholderia cenocepacia]|uniref:hypothetical protein n=1 Tax=Burkholderia cenocepacia TaxID=95486 RepID=UPI002237A24D|nr:hypothetical protein [Burkholderia cenocepacia]MCW5156309.1 hypothetical protein [Burkholderia cenocepacia]